MFLLKNKKLLIVCSIFVIAIVCGSFSAEAGILNDTSIRAISDHSDAAGESAGFDFTDEKSLGEIMGTVIKVFIMLLGIVFVFLLVLEGYKWMMARGEEEKVREARDGIMRAVIGIIIVISAYAITYFVFTNLPEGGSSGIDATANY